MIYRIAIYKDGKFDHYADSQELQRLRVTALGKVEQCQIAIYHNYQPNNQTKSDLFWFDGSETHKVEWGFNWNGINVYENDIISNGKSNRLVTYDNNIMSFSTNHCSRDKVLAIYEFIMLHELALSYSTVIGNLNQNPELLEGN